MKKKKIYKQKSQHRFINTAQCAYVVRDYYHTGGRNVGVFGTSWYHVKRPGVL